MKKLKNNNKSSLLSKIKLFIVKKEFENLLIQYKNELSLKDKIKNNKKRNQIDPYGEEEWDD